MTFFEHAAPFELPADVTGLESAHSAWLAGCVCECFAALADHLKINFSGRDGNLPVDHKLIKKDFHLFKSHWVFLSKQRFYQNL